MVQVSSHPVGLQGQACGMCCAPSPRVRGAASREGLELGHWAHSGLGGGRHFPKRPIGAYPPQSPHHPTLHPTPSPPLCRRRHAVRTPGCARQLSDRKRPRPASPESAIYLCFVPCQWFMPWGSEIRQWLCWCYAACFAQKTPRGAVSLLFGGHGSAPAGWERGSRDPAETLGSDS